MNVQNILEVVLWRTFILPLYRVLADHKYGVDGEWLHWPATQPQRSDGSKWQASKRHAKAGQDCNWQVLQGLPQKLGAAETAWFIKKQ